MLQLTQFLAVLCTAVFSGAALYVNLVEHPARMLGGSRAALTQWAPSYRRATVMQASLALIGFGASLAVWLMVGGWGWLAAAMMIGGVVPFTFLVVMPTNRALEAIDPGEADATSDALLERWNRLHAGRTALGLGALGLSLAQLVWS